MSKQNITNYKKLYYVVKYLKSLQEKKITMPDFVDKLTEDDRNTKNPNLIYPIGNSVFIHADGINIEGDRYPIYKIISPEQPDPLLFSNVERRFAIYASQSKPPDDKEQRNDIIDAYLNSICEKTTQKPNYQNIAKSKKILVNIEDFNSLKYYFKRKRVGLDLLEPYLSDPYLEDISMVGGGKSFIVHKMFGPMRVSDEISNEELDDMLITMAEQFGKSMSNARPIVDARLPDGSRINIVFGNDISLHGTNLTIRRFSGIPISITQIINYKTIDAKSAAFLWMLLEQGMSLFVCGETASGKTTTLTALTTFIDPTLKIVSIEDTPEISIPHKNWVNEVTRDTGNNTSTIDMQDLLKAALRQRPNYIIVGEIRGVEANVAFQAMQTGHPVLSTFHAATVSSLTQRLINDPINIPKTNIDNLNVVVIQGAVTGKSGHLVRRVLSVNEIVGYDSDLNQVMFTPLFKWDSSKDEMRFTGNGSSVLFKSKLLQLRGFAENEEVKLYDELENREEILLRLVRNKVFNYYDVFKEIAKVSEIGVTRYLQERFL